MSRRNRKVSSQPSAISDQPSVRMVTVGFTEDDVKLLINVIRATPVQGNIQSLPQMIARLNALQEKLAAGLKNTGDTK